MGCISELGIQAGDEITVADATTPNAIGFIVNYTEAQ